MVVLLLPSEQEEVMVVLLHSDQEEVMVAPQREHTRR